MSSSRDDAVGTKVFDAHGLTKVVATKRNGVKDVLRLHTKAGHQLDLSRRTTSCGGAPARATGRFVSRRAQLQRRRQAGVAPPRRRSARPRSASREIAEAALAGWLQSDGFVGQYDTGTNRSLTIEAMTVTPAELDVGHRPRLTRCSRTCTATSATVVTQDSSLDCRRTRLYGVVSSTDFVERWGLRARGVDMVVPAPLVHRAAAGRGALTCAACSRPRATCRVARRSTLVGLGHGLRAARSAACSHSSVDSASSLASARKADTRPDRHGLLERLRIQNAGDRRIFADEIGFIDPIKAAKLEPSVRPARACLLATLKRLRDRAHRAARRACRSTTSRPSPASTSSPAFECTTASSCPSTTRWTRSSTGTGKRA